MAQWSVPTVSPEFAAVVSEGVFQPSVFYFADGGDTSAAFAARVRELPRFQLGPRDTAIPSELANLPPDAEVIHRQGGGDTVCKAGDVAKVMQKTISERLGPKGERISLADLPDALLEALKQHSDAVANVSKEGLSDRVKWGASTGALRVRHPETDLSEAFSEWPEPSASQLVCSVHDVNEWLATDGAGYRLNLLDELKESSSDEDDQSDSPGVKSTGIVKHSTTSERPNVLSPIIDECLRIAKDPNNNSSVWAELQNFADKPESERPTPLLGQGADGILYRGNDGVSHLTFKQFSARLGRLRKADAKP